ncbi:MULTISPECIES: hypothetical protein [Bradyrhizobium]|uniref:hypothetical protein n=1 Tax=Bradyrhizobium TaxID=374 RepID=UPI0009FC6B07|nr:hypothetical protein [Bradyrhizobium sp. USDA 3456]
MRTALPTAAAPRHLQGVPCRFMVMITDANHDGTASEIGKSECGSVTFCGKKDRSWPDKYEMGYPFDRLLQRLLCQIFFKHLPNVVWRDVIVRCKHQANSTSARGSALVVCDAERNS